MISDHREEDKSPQAAKDCSPESAKMRGRKAGW